MNRVGPFILPHSAVTDVLGRQFLGLEIQCQHFHDGLRDALQMCPNGSRSLLQDHEGFQVVVHRAYQSCEQAVQDQIARLTLDGDSEPELQDVVEVRTSPAITGAPVNRIPATQFMNQTGPRPATASKANAIRAIAARRKIGSRIAQPMALPAASPDR